VQDCGMQVEILDPAVREYIKELKANYEKQYVELPNKVNEIETNHKPHYQQLYNKYVILKEQAD
jgi:hypothetical protein